VGVGVLEDKVNLRITWVDALVVNNGLDGLSTCYCAHNFSNPDSTLSALAHAS